MKIKFLSILFLLQVNFLQAQKSKATKHFKEEEVTFLNKKDSVSLSGTLTYPKKGEKFPVLILISGSGPSTRDESIGKLHPFKTIAEYLSANGYAVLRYDDRGCGKSTGKNYPQHTSADLATDVEAAINFVKSNKHVLPNKIGLLGHSEGGMIAPMVASRSHDVAFIVSLAGPGCKITDVMLQQNKLVFLSSGIPSQFTDRYLNLFFAPLLKTMTAQNEIPVVRKDIYRNLSDYHKMVPDSESKKFVVLPDTLFTELIIAQMYSPWFRYFLSYDPRNDWEKIKQPVLAINGTKDIQVDASQNLPCISECLTKANNKNFKIVSAEGYNHLFQKAKTGSVAEYFTLEGDVSPEILEIILKWLNELPN